MLTYYAVVQAYAFGLGYVDLTERMPIEEAVQFALRKLKDDAAWMPGPRDIRVVNDCDSRVKSMQAGEPVIDYHRRVRSVQEFKA